MNAYSQEDAGANRHLFPRAPRNLGCQAADLRWCYRSRMPRQEGHSTYPVFVRESSLRRWNAIVLECARENLLLHARSEIFPDTLKIVDKQFCERNSPRTSLMAPLDIIISLFSFTFCYQIIFSANWICREVVDVESIKPAPGVGPDPSNNISLFVGGLKLA